MQFVQHPETRKVHLTREGDSVTLCGRWDCGPNSQRRPVSDARYTVTCDLCIAARARIREYGIPEEDLAASVLYVTAMGSGQIVKTHYTYNGAKSVCGVLISHIPLMRADEDIPASCDVCKASPNVPKEFRNDAALARMRGRGHYDRSHLKKGGS